MLLNGSLHPVRLVVFLTTREKQLEFVHKEVTTGSKIKLQGPFADRASLEFHNVFDEEVDVAMSNKSFKDIAAKITVAGPHSSNLAPPLPSFLP